jgi:hypothetical protein
MNQHEDKYMRWLEVVSLTEKLGGCYCHHTCNGECHFQRRVMDKEEQRLRDAMTEKEFAAIQEATSRREIEKRVSNKIRQRNGLEPIRGNERAPDRSSEIEVVCGCFDEAIKNIEVPEDRLELWEARRQQEIAFYQLKKLNSMVVKQERIAQEANDTFRTLQTTTSRERVRKRARGMSGSGGIGMRGGEGFFET